jgi:eukaryotic-like serine/threonine-protein kinase
MISPNRCFVFNNYSYIITSTLLAHPDYGRLLLASRREPIGRGKQSRAKLVVLKPVSTALEDAALHRALEEIELARRLNHPNIVGILGYAVDEDRRQPFVVMNYTRGRSLLTLIVTASTIGRMLTPAFAAYVASEVADALDQAHRARDDGGRHLNIVHRAVSPMNIQVGHQGEVRLLNFGSAFSHLLERLQTRPGVLRGDPAYIAPEILRAYLHPERGQRDCVTPRCLDGRADLFSLGLVLLEMLILCYPLDTHENLWRGVQKEFPARVQSERPTPIPLEVLANRLLRFGPKEAEFLTRDVEKPLQAILAKTLRSRPEDRYSTAGEMRDALRAYLGGLPYAYGRKQAEEELTSIFETASRAESPPVYPGVERGALPAPPDTPKDRATETVH